MHIITASGDNFEFDFTNQKLQEHFDNGSSYAKLIVNQINTDKLYERFLGNRTNLQIVDIGANIGLFTLYASTIADKIICVEPTPDHIELLRFNTKDMKNVQIIEAAVTDVPQSLTFFLNDNNSTMNSFEYKTNKSITVSGMTMDQILEYTSHVDFIKFDIEGGEVKALTKNQIEAVYTKVDSWFIEAHETSSASIQQNRFILEARFKDVGYNAERIGVDGLYVYK